MRTTISLADGLAEDVRRRAAELGLSVSAFIESVLRERLHEQASEPAREPFDLVTYGSSGPREGIDLDRAAKIVEADDVSAASLAKAGR